MVRTRLTLARVYCDLLRFWGTCADKRCRRLRHCRDRTGHCWNARYPLTGPMTRRLRARIKSKRRAQPAWLRNWQRCYDPSDSML